ncbi:MAG: hypothetical protein R6V44_13820 [Paracoccaceae bacterium]
MTAVLAVAATHLYRGAALRPLTRTPDPPAEILVEFSDGVAVPARLLPGLRLEVAAHVTAKGTRIPAKAWALGTDPARPGALKATARLD